MYMYNVPLHIMLSISTFLIFYVSIKNKFNLKEYLYKTFNNGKLFKLFIEHKMDCDNSYNRICMCTAKRQNDSVLYAPVRGNLTGIT
jgi:hypothetical protein